MMDETKDVRNEINEESDPAQTAPDAPKAEAPEAAAPQQAAEASGADKESKDDKKKKKHDKEQEKLREEAEKLKGELESFKDRLLRTAAEYDNYRKRTDREKAASVSLGVSNAVDKLLPVLDTLELAADAETADEAYKKGVTMTLSMFREALASLGVEPIEDVGAAFDPNLHCAVAREASDAESGTVVKVMRKGYKLGDKVIRPTMVSVAE